MHLIFVGMENVIYKLIIFMKFFKFFINLKLRTKKNNIIHTTHNLPDMVWVMARKGGVARRWWWPVVGDVMVGEKFRFLNLNIAVLHVI